MMEVEPDGTLVVGDFERILEAGETCSIAGDYVTCTCDEEDTDEECCDCIDQSVPVCDGIKCKEAKLRSPSFGTMSSFSDMSGLLSPGLMSPMSLGLGSPILRGKKKAKTPISGKRATLSPCCPGCMHPMGGPVCTTCGRPVDEQRSATSYKGPGMGTGRESSRASIVAHGASSRTTIGTHKTSSRTTLGKAHKTSSRSTIATAHRIGAGAAAEGTTEELSTTPTGHRETAGISSRSPTRTAHRTSTSTRASSKSPIGAAQRALAGAVAEEAAGKSSRPSAGESPRSPTGTAHRASAGATSRSPTRTAHRTSTSTRASSRSPIGTGHKTMTGAGAEEAAGKSSRPSAGEAAGKPSRPSAGEAAGKPSRPSAGEAAGRSSRPIAGEAAGKSPRPSAGEAAGKSSRPIAGEAAGKSPRPSAGESPRLPTDAAHRAKSRSPTEAALRAKSRSPTEAAHRAKSRSPTEAAHRAKSRSPTEAAPRAKSRSPTEAAPRAKSRSPTEAAHRAKSGSPSEAAQRATSRGITEPISDAIPRKITAVAPEETAREEFKSTLGTPNKTNVDTTSKERKSRKKGYGRYYMDSTSSDVGLKHKITKGGSNKRKLMAKKNKFESPSSGTRLNEGVCPVENCAIPVVARVDTDEVVFEDSERSILNTGHGVIPGMSSKFGSASYAGYSFLKDSGMGGPRFTGLEGSKSAHQVLDTHDIMFAARVGRRQGLATALRGHASSTGSAVDAIDDAKLLLDELSNSRDPSFARQEGSWDASDGWLGRQLRGIRSSALAAKRNLCQMRDKIMDVIGGSTINLGSHASRPIAVDGAPRMPSSRVPRTVSPPSAHVKRFGMPQGSNSPTFERNYSKRLSDRISPFHHKDHYEKNKKTRRKRSTDYSDLQASQKAPPYKRNEFEEFYSTVNTKTKKLDGASTPKFVKSRERAKRKRGTTGATKRKAADRRPTVPYNESETTVLPDSIEQQKLNPNKQKWPIIDSIKQTTNHIERQQIMTSPEHTERRKPSTSPDRNATLFDDAKHRKPAASPDRTDHGKPVGSPDQAERRRPAISPDRAERGKSAPSPGRTERRQPATPEVPDQRQTTAPKDGDRRSRRSVARGDSRAAAVAEAVANCSSSSAYPVWLRRR